MKNKPIASEITNRLAELRTRRGLSASALAELVGVSRQTIYAVEGGTYIPNTAIGLRLGKVLGVAVEELFSLTGAAPIPRKVTFLPHSESLQTGQPVQLCKVNDKLIAAPADPASWYLPTSDATLLANNQVQLHEPDADSSHRLLLAGCDPAMGVLDRYLRPAGIHLVLLHRNSSQSLSLLKSGFAHLAGSHLRDAASDDSNRATVNRLFPSKSAALVSFALWQEGFVTAAGNPRRIKGVLDLARKDVTFINREEGSGSRTLVDRYLAKAAIHPKMVSGYLTTASGHLSAARKVKAGLADCCVATEACARFLGLHFIPLETVRYDLVLRRRQLNTPGIQVLLDSISHLRFRQKLASLGGYDTSVTGARLQ